MWYRRIISNTGAGGGGGGGRGVWYRHAIVTQMLLDLLQNIHSTAKCDMLMDRQTKININLVHIFSCVVPLVAVICCAVVNKV